MELPCDTIKSPADPDVSYNAHRGHGYGVQVVETYAEDDEAAGVLPTDPPIPDLITYIDVHKLTQHDSHALEPALAELTERQLCPDQILGDSHYGGHELLERVSAKGIELLAPAMPPKGYKKGHLGLEQFELDADGRVVACPEGQVPVWTSVGNVKIEARFDPTRCESCVQHSKCPAYANLKGERRTRWQYTPERVTQCRRRLADQQPAFRNRYRWRAGVEATMSRLKYQMRLAHLRVRGMSAVRYTVFLRAVGLNILRVECNHAIWVLGSFW